MNTNNPQSRLWLCKTDLENDYKNTLTFSNFDSQRNYFIGNPLDPTDFGVSTKSYTEFTYLRLEQFIKVNDFIEDIDTNNYLVLINNNKYYYYFITSMEYIDDETTRINIELDVMQTFFFDIVYKNTFIEREHVTDDTRGVHTIPENVELGDYITQAGSESLIQRQDLYFLINDNNRLPVFAVTHTPDGTTPPAGTVTPQYNGSWSGLWYLVVNNDETDFARAIQQIDNTADCELYAIFMAPSSLVNPALHWETSTGGYNFKYTYVTSNNSETQIGTIGVNKENHLATNYVPRNKKLLTFPYCYFQITNYAGNVVNYKYEDFSGDYGQFEILGAVSIGCDIKLLPTANKPAGQGQVIGEINYYKDRFSYAVDMYKLPTCPWVSDSYTNWLTQNSVNLTLSNISTAGSLALGAFAFSTGHPMIGAGAIGTGLNGIKEQISQHETNRLAPDSAQLGSNMGNINFALHNTFNIKKYTIKEEYARIIDKYFDMFGYQVNILKSPNIHTRKYWNYLKTNGCNFTGDIPQTYMNKIKSIFDNGITFWHDPSKMFDYSQTNSILS